MPLSTQQRKNLRARAHALHPVVLIGSNGLSAAVLKEIDTSLRAHELIKIHVAGEDREVRRALLEEICSALGAEAVQTIGRVLVLFREKPPEDASRPARPKRPRAPRATKRSFQSKA
ncbi:MAG: ribosome assembly RNA-binding protein YhbY [Betaproteobacteria bacterium]|nr:ribosome assembly RNA-binding protein YhbY [Betaproteobacteria bacterium]